jgi:hypothetical protein
VRLWFLHPEVLPPAAATDLGASMASKRNEEKIDARSFSRDGSFVASCWHEDSQPARTVFLRGHGEEIRLEIAHARTRFAYSA